MSTNSQRLYRGARYKTWQTMRLFAKQGLCFTAPDIVGTDASLTLDNVQRTIRRLVDHGYVSIVKPARLHTVYRLVKDTGPEAPVLQADGSLTDRNTGVTLMRGPE